jgi:phosphoserine phosphatase
MVFDFACAQERFKDRALSALADFAAAQGINEEPQSDANTMAKILKNAFYAGRIEERAVAEMQVWAYVGYCEQEFRDLVRSALQEGRHHEMLHDQVLEIADWVTSQGARTGIVSASPRWVIEEATANFDFFPTDAISAGDPRTLRTDAGLVIDSGMASPLPYGPDKIDGGKRLLGKRKWLAAFGDSHFDLEMMGEAALAVGIGQKEGLLSGLGRLTTSVRFVF